MRSWCSIVLLGSFLLLSGCGYSLAGRGSFLPDHIKTIAVPKFVNLSDREGVAELFTNAVVQELTSRGKYTIVADQAVADAVLLGSVTAFNIAPVTFDAGADPESQNQASRYSVVIRASVDFNDLVSDSTLWSDNAFAFRDLYEVGENPDEFFDQQGLALNRMAEDFAKTLVSRLLEAF